MTCAEQFEQALETLGEFAAEGNDNPRVIEAMGLATLRMPLLPSETPPERREMVLMAGRASYMMATRNTASAEKAFQALVARYPRNAERSLRLRRLPACRSSPTRQSTSSSASSSCNPSMRGR